MCEVYCMVRDTAHVWKFIYVFEIIRIHLESFVTFFINLLAPELFFLILAHTVYKMWIIQEPNTLELWNKLRFEEEKNGEYIPCLKY